jgi:O-acetyl-ADP-ribose deacetylase (regulator of RNase III)
MDRNKNISLVIRRLLAEHPDAVGYTIPTSLNEQQYMLRALLNVRAPKPADDELLATQDLELQAQLADKGIVRIEDIAPSQLDKRLYLWKGDITRLQVDAIVNAANSALLGCFVPNHRCIDNAIHSAAGIQLRLACRDIMEKQGYPEPTGQAKSTPGFNLPSRYVLHTVGPIVHDGEPSKKQCEELANCYRECLSLADRNGLQSVAFCCISTGVFGFPQEPAARIALNTVIEYLDNTPDTHIHTAIFNVFKDEDYEIYQRLLSQ